MSLSGLNGQFIGGGGGGSLLPPAAPAGVEAVALSTTSIRVMWDFVAMALSFDVYKQSGLSWIKVSSDVAGSSTDISGLTATTEYTFRVIAKNEVGSSAPSETVTVKTKSLGSVLERITNSIIQLVSGKDADGNPATGFGIRISNGNYFDWFYADTDDSDAINPSAHEAWCNVTLDAGEDSLESVSMTDARSMDNEVKYKIEIWFSLETISERPKKAYVNGCGRVLEDIKKVINSNYGLLPETGAEQMFYTGCTYEPVTDGDIITAGKLTTRWGVRYVQDRLNPNTTY